MKAPGQTRVFSGQVIAEMFSARSLLAGALLATNDTRIVFLLLEKSSLSGANARSRSGQALFRCASR
jgi:hypothetical protein